MKGENTEKTSKNILFIINTKTGRNNKRSDVLEELKKRKRTEEAHIKVIETQYAGHAKHIARDHLESEYSIFVAVGGDGTVNEVGSILINSNKILAVLPLGSGNGFSHQINKKKKTKNILNAIFSDDFFVKKIDTASLNNVPFLNIAGIGFDGQLSKSFGKSQSRGLVTYIELAIKQFISYKRYSYTIYNQGVTDNGIFLMISFANSPEYGNRFVISPSSNLSDGKLEICAIPHFKKYQLLTLIIALLFRRKKIKNLVKYQSFEKCCVETIDDLPMHVDGEYICSGTQCNVEINKLSLNVLMTY